MRCPKCNAENRYGARFCGRCGHPIAVAAETRLHQIQDCPICGGSVKSGARFCPQCGADLRASRPLKTPPPSPPMGAPEPRAPVSRQSEQGKLAVWWLGLLAALLVTFVTGCLFLGIVAGPALGRPILPQPAADPARQDITILVEEAYIAAMLGEALPHGPDSEMTVDVRAGNQILVTAGFDLVFFKLDVVVDTRITTEAGRIRIAVMAIETGGQDILSLIGIDRVEFGDRITGAIQQGLENELGGEARLLDITTDESRVILRARWD